MTTQGKDSTDEACSDVKAFQPWTLRHLEFLQSLTAKQFVQFVELQEDWTKEDEHEHEFMELIDQIMPCLDTRPDVQDEIIALMGKSTNDRVQYAAREYFQDVAHRRIHERRIEGPRALQRRN